MPEVIEDAAILVNPRNFVAVARQPNNDLKDSSLRSYLVQKGLENSKRFSKEKFTKFYWNTILE